MPLSPANSALVRARRLRIYAMRKACMSYEEIAGAEGISVAVAMKDVERAVTKEGMPKLDVDVPMHRGAMAADPQQVGQVLAGLIVGNATTAATNQVDRFEDLRKACAGAGLKPSIVTSLIRRLDSTLSPVLEAGKKYTVAELSGKLEEKIAMVLSYIDDYALANAGAKDLSIALNVLIEKHQLINNKPTMIVDMNTRRNLGELFPVLAAEARRRGVTLEGTATRVEGAS